MNFLTKEEVLELHRQNIEEFGGSHGFLNKAAKDAFESALMAAENRHYYQGVDEVACAATYGFHLSQAHAFSDGNKRVGAAAMIRF